MSFYRTLLAALAALAIASPVFADDAATDPSAATVTNTQETATDVNNGVQTTTTTTSESVTQTKINLNTASLKELMKVKGLNSTKAKAIIAYRKKNGSFKTVDELSKVKGFSNLKNDTLLGIQDQVTVE